MLETMVQGIIAQTEQSFLSSGTALSNMLSTRNTAARFMENSFDWSLAYKKSFRNEGQELDVLITNTFGNNNTTASQLTDYLSGNYPVAGIQSVSPGTDRETDVSADYSQPMTKDLKLETGAKATFENIHTDAAADTLLTDGNYGQDLAQTYNFGFRRNIYAAYVSASFSLFNNFLSGNAGARYEETHSVIAFAGIQIPDNQLLAPSLTLQHKLNQAASLTFAYTYRVERP